jgi:DNA modification methylase
MQALQDRLRPRADLMSLIRGDALAIPLADNSVDLVCTSPPYFALRSYQDDGEHYDNQIGSEPTPQAFLEALWAVTGECRRVLKPSGSMFVNLGDKYAGSMPGGPGTMIGTSGKSREAAHLEHGGYYKPDTTIRTKSLMGMPWRYAIGCIDQLDLILRAEIIWNKPNGLPESVQDRVRRSHEQWFMFTKEPRYYSCIDEIREPHAPSSLTRYESGFGQTVASAALDKRYESADIAPNPLGKLPGSVWTIPTEPLRTPDHLPQHFAAFPSEWPRRIILGWSPPGICVECGEGRRPVVDLLHDRPVGDWKPDRDADGGANRPNGNARPTSIASITGYVCACPTPDAPTRPSVILDPFCGTGTSVAVANHLGRHGIGIDLSADYLKLARWRCNDPALRAKVLGVEKPRAEVPGQQSLL